MNVQHRKPDGVKSFQIPDGSTIYHVCAGHVTGLAAVGLDAPVFSGVRTLAACATCDRWTKTPSIGRDLFTPDGQAIDGRCGNHYKVGGPNPFVARYVEGS